MTKVITAITAQKRNTQRLNISLDGEYAFSLDRLTAAWLKVGRKLSPEEIVSLQEKDEQEVAFNRALRYLSYRARSEAEMRKYLSDKGFSDHVSQTVIDRLKDERLINDPRFAQDWIDNRVSFRPRSQTQLRFELRNKGLSEDLSKMPCKKLI
ncbi:MAG TPA: RecX family transcriptional regulator [Anaerolineaceae bacterium]|nr:RecX family transcriptional regulator [Anaerolineaceae bacterium]